MTKVINKTTYDTATLEAIFAACVAAVTAPTKGQLKIVHVRTHHLKKKWGVKDGKNILKVWRPWVGGYAWYYGDTIVMKLPHPKYGPLAQRAVADTFIHELGHVYGHRHKRYPETPGLSTIEHKYQDWLTATFGEQTVPLGKPEPKKVIDHQAIRFARAQANLAKAATRLKRAQTIHRKWKTKVRYYQGAIAAKTAPKGGEAS